MNDLLKNNGKNWKLLTRQGQLLNWQNIEQHTVLTVLVPDFCHDVCLRRTIMKKQQLREQRCLPE